MKQEQFIRNKTVSRPVAARLHKVNKQTYFYRKKFLENRSVLLYSRWF